VQLVKSAQQQQAACATIKAGVKHESQKDKTKDSRHKNRYKTQAKINQFNQSINLFSQLCNNKNECQQNDVKHSDGLSEKQIAHLSWSPK